MALALGAPSVAALQARMGAAEFTEWVAYSELEPFGFPADNYRTGTVAAAAWNATGKLRRPAVAADFYPATPDNEPAKLTDPADQQAFFLALAAAKGGNNGTIRRPAKS